tara:strand:- start:649 stop:1584 length:936 start_codon:yes stop_codon:yes gene_type:complete
MTYLIYFLIIFSYSNAQIDYGFEFSKSGSAGFQFLKINADAVSSSLGGASITNHSASKNLNANIASITGLEKSSATFSNSNWLSNSVINNASLIHKFGDYYLGLSIISFSTKKFEKTTVSMPSGTGELVSAGNNLIGVSIAKSFTDKLSLGLQIKYIEEVLDTYTFNNVMVDVGSLYETGYRDIKIAFVLQHFGPDISPIKMKFRSPLVFRIGISDFIFHLKSNSLRLMAEVFHPTDDEDFMAIGLEYALSKKIFFRIGNQFNTDLFGISYGFGINDFKIAKQFKLAIDYGLVMPNKIFNDLKIISLTISK